MPKREIRIGDEALQSYADLALRTASGCLRHWEDAIPPFVAYVPNVSGVYEAVKGVVWMRDNLITSEATLGLVEEDTLTGYLLNLARRQMPAGATYRYGSADPNILETEPLPADGIVAEILNPTGRFGHLSGTLDPEPGFVEMAYLTCVWRQKYDLLTALTPAGRPLIDHLHDALNLFSFDLRYDPEVGLCWGGAGSSWGDAPAHYGGTSENDPTGYATYPNVYVWKACRMLSFLCRKAGDTERAAFWQGRAVALREAILCHLWNPEGWLKVRLRREPETVTVPEARAADEGIDYEGNAMAISAGLLTPAQARLVFAKVERDHAEFPGGFLPMFWPLYPDGYLQGYPKIWVETRGLFQNGGIWARTQYALALAGFRAGDHDFGFRTLYRMAAKEADRGSLWEWWAADESRVAVKDYGWNTMGLTTIVRGLFGVRHDMDGDKIVIEPSSRLRDLGPARLALDFGEGLTVEVRVDKAGEITSAHSFPSLAGIGSRPVVAARPVASLSLSGTDWFIHEDAEGTGVDDKLHEVEVTNKGWIPAQVPGNIQADLEAAHTLKPLWYGAGDPRLAKVAQKDWWYRRDFVVPQAFEGKRVKLIFDGVDHACEVWLNGTRLGTQASMFRRFGFDVAGVINPGQANQLAVKISRMPDELVEILVASDGKMSGVVDGKPGPYFFVDGINKTRQIHQDLKSATNFGWDWGVNIYTLGIWKDVRLEVTGPARIEWVQVQTELSDFYRKAKVKTNLEIDSVAELDVKARFTIRGHGQDATSTIEATLKSGHNAIKADLVLDDPAPWWPNGQGDQPLYELEARLEDASTGQLLDERTTRFGVREVRWGQVEGAPLDFINPFKLVVNGRPVRMMGSNIIPPDLLFGRMNDRGPRLVQLAKNAGINTLRVWGGGVLLTEEMYDLADELGIMLSQEFPLANCSPETDPVFLGNLDKTVRNIVKQFRNHPCIIEWTGGNEMSWKQGDDHPALHLLQRVVAETDTRIFRATCPIQGSRHSPWNYDPKTHYAHYDNEELTDNLGGARMMRYGEFGCHTPANLEIWQREIPPADQWPPDDLENPILIRKNVVQAVFTKEYWLLKSVTDSLFGRVDTLESLVEAGQFLGAEGLRYAIDALRRRGKRIGGFTTWDYNEPWPNGAGSFLVDYDGRPLMNYDFVRQALSPLGLSLKYDSILYDPAVGVDVELWLVSDAPGPVSGLNWDWTARDRRGRVIAQFNGRSVSIEPHEAVKLGRVKAKPSAETALGPMLIETRLSDAAGNALADRLHIFGAEGLPTPFAGLLHNTVPDEDDGDVCSTMARPVRRTDLEVSAHWIRVDGDDEIMEIELVNSGEMTALFCEPGPLLAYRTDVTVLENHAFIPPGEKRTLTILAPANPEGGLTLGQTGWRISCWNADDVIISPNEEVLLALGRRDAMTREYLGYKDHSKIGKSLDIELKGSRPDSSNLPLLLAGNTGVVRFVFNVDGRQAERPSRLRIHTADQDDKNAPVVEVTVNGQRFEQALGTGLGIQNTDPAHLAFPATARFDLPAGALRAGENTLEVRVRNASWFSWDALDLVTM